MECCQKEERFVIFPKRAHVCVSHWIYRFLTAQAHLNDVTTKGSSQALLFGIVELIVGQVPGIFNLRLGHVL